jgi:murein DD-endopeptidase MepM/ murein hydrolase activator NlpD
MPGPAAIGVPNFFIDKFRIPPFLLPIYQAAGMEYGIRWEILAAINEIETDYGRNLNVSSAGALGWMQFMPATWKAYGVDANGDGRKDPYNPVDAIFAAARYLEAAGGEKDLRKAIFAYNHADWYVDSVLMRARLVGGLPVDLVGSISGLTEGRFPLNGKARYADDLDEKKATRTIARGSNAALPVDGDANRRGVDIYAAEGTQVVATHDGEIVRRGVDERLGTFVQVRDTHGNTYTYGDLGKLTPSHPVPKRGAKRNGATPIPQDEAETAAPTPGTPAGKERLFAHPRRPKAYKAGGARQVPAPVPRSNDEYVRDLLDLGPNQVTWKRLKPGSRVVAGTILGYVGKQTARSSSHLKFEIRPAGRGAPRIDPKPILDGWKLLESTAIYRASNKNPFHGKDSTTPTVGQILLMSKDALQKRVLDNGLIALTESGRLDIRSGRIDRRVLAVLEYLAANGLKPTVSSLYRPGSITTSGNVSHHSVGTAVDISAINGTPVIGNQGKGSITDIANRRLLNLQGAMKPDQIISLMTYPGATNTIAMGDHHDHIHVGFRPVGDNAQTSRAVNATLKPGQWFKVIDRLNEIENPVVRKTPSAASLKVTPKRRAR